VREGSCRSEGLPWGKEVGTGGTDCDRAAPQSTVDSHARSTHCLPRSARCRREFLWQRVVTGRDRSLQAWRRTEAAEGFVPFPDQCTIEARRTFLACYWTCSHIAISLRRPNMLRITIFIRESVVILMTSPAGASDQVFCQRVKLHMIVDKATETFEFILVRTCDPRSKGAVAIGRWNLEGGLEGGSEKLGHK